ncbi:MAG: hypothetical protein Q8N26_30145 [Myxococcales bacterium]|nr:hypothetical protein [Myxococcales bacterium]
MADTRTRPQRIDGDAEVQDLAPVDLDASTQRLDSFPELLRALNAVPDSARPDIATRLNDVLIAMRAPGDESEEAELVMEALSSKELHDVIDTRGRSCRKEAVQTMMACGFPHALMLDPDDMAFARSFVQVRKAPSATSSQENTIDDDALEPWESGMRGNRRLGAAVMSALQIFSAILSLIEVPGAMALAAVGLSFVGLFAASALAFSRPRDFNIATFGAFATILALVGFIVALAAKSWLIAIAPIGVAVGLYVSIAALYEELTDPPSPDESGSFWDVNGF